MAQPKSQTGIAAPLFEKLIDLAPNSAEDDQDLWFQTADAAAASIRREVTRIFDTRIPWPENGRRDRAEGNGVDRNKTVLGYGVPDLSHLSVTNQADLKTIRRMLTEAIRTFEPRLMNPRVTLSVDRRRVGVMASISGTVRLKRSLEPLAFSVRVVASPSKRK